MKKLLFLPLAFTLLACTRQPVAEESLPTGLSENAIQSAIDSALTLSPTTDQELMRRGIAQCAALWTSADGSEEEFAQFVKKNYAATPEARQQLFESLSRIMETIRESADQLSVELGRPTVLTNASAPTRLDYLMGGYSPMSHFGDDMFANKMAFILTLNFPNFSLQEKNELGRNWTRQQWAEARMGDMFTSRIPGEVNSMRRTVSSDAENYISSYNVYMGHLLTADGRKMWPEDMVLLSHWNLRDELKANYADLPDAREKQEMIYEVMLRIVRQEIPEMVINNGDYDWAPYSNEVKRGEEAVTAAAEPDTRYQHILNNFHAYQVIDRYHPTAPTAIIRNFDSSIELPAEEVERLFIECVSSPQIQKVAARIKERLGRDLRPYDIWYDGFKSRSALPEEQLTAQTRRQYPDAEAFHKDTPRMLREIGFSADEAQFLSDHVVVEPARGSGHARGSSGRHSPARLRTRIGKEGMDYKGYNIAVHEFGHNVEQVTSLYHMDHYMLHGVPNTGFTEASAFIFQQRDLQLLGYGRQEMDQMATLDMFWNMYEIMGVSLVDMRMWQWLYAHPEADAATLKEAVLNIAAEVWNAYYAPVLGEENTPLLAVYSHMIDAPMYLPNYPLGHIIHYQLEQHLGALPAADFAREYKRIYQLGCLTPDVWMQQAVGQPLSIQPVLEAVDKILQ